MRYILFLTVLFFNMFLPFSFSQEESSVRPIVVWHWMTDRKEAFSELAKEYEVLTGIKVKFQLYAPSDEYQQKIQAAAQGKKLPDIFGVLGRKQTFASYVKAGYVENMAPYMGENDDEWKSLFYKESLAINAFESGNIYGIIPGIYGVPIDMMNVQLLYNKKAFKTAGLDPFRPPATWDEWLVALDKLKAAGFSGLTSGWGEIWLINSFAYDYAYHLMGKEGLVRTFKGEKLYTDPEWVKVFSLFSDMREKGMVDPQIITLVNKEAERLFAIEKAAFAYNGSWSVNVYHGLNPDLEYGTMFMPRLESDPPMFIWGGAGSSFMVSSNSDVKMQAVDFLKWLTDKRQQEFLIEKTKNLPSNKFAVAGLTPLMQEFSSSMGNIYHLRTLPVQEDPEVLTVMGRGLQKIILGERTAEDIAKQLQRLKDKQKQGMEATTVEKLVPFIILCFIVLFVVGIIFKKTKSAS